MPHYRIKTASVVTIWQSAVVEIDARSRAAALRKAEEMNDAGRLEWREDASDQNDPTIYTVIDRED